MMRKWKSYEEYVNFIEKLIVDNNWQENIEISNFIAWADKNNIGLNHQSVMHLTRLNLWNKNLTEIPNSIGYLRKLEYLNISYNDKLIKIPESIIELKNLNEFVISRKIKCNNAGLLVKMKSRNPKLKIITH